jgi:hypothetical protein
MKKIILLIILILVGGVLFTGCSSNVVQDNSIEDYILLNTNIPVGFILTPLSNKKDSSTKNLKSNPGGFNPESTMGNGNLNVKDTYEEEMELNTGEYIFVSYLHEESGRELTLTLVDSKVADKFIDVGHTGSTKVLVTKEGHLIWIQSSIITEDFIDLYIKKFTEVSRREKVKLDEKIMYDKIDILTQSLRGDLSESKIYSKNFSNDTLKNQIHIGFTYFGGNAGDINTKNLVLKTITNDSCPAIEVKNIKNEKSGINENITFLSGNSGLIIFDCSSINQNSGLISSEVFDGEISIGVTNSRSPTLNKNKGKVRLLIN